MRLLGGKSKSAPAVEVQSVAGYTKSTTSTPSSGRRSSSDSSSRQQRSYEQQQRQYRREPPNSRRSEASTRDRESVRSSTASRSTSRGRSTERQQQQYHSSGNSSRRSASVSRQESSRSRATSEDYSRASSRGRSRTSSRDPSASPRYRSSSQSSRRSASASRASSRDHRSYSNSKSPKGTYGLSRQDTGQVVVTNGPPSVRSSSRGRGASEVSVTSRKSSNSKGMLGLRESGASVTSGGKSVSTSSRGGRSKSSTGSGKRRSRRDKSSRSQPLLDDRARVEDGDHSGTSSRERTLTAIESDLEYGGTVGGDYTVASTVGYPYVSGSSKYAPLDNPEPMVNGLLIQLKFESEVCPWPLRFMLVICALGMFATSLLPYFLGYTLYVSDVIISTLTACLSILIILLEGRFSCIGSDPAGCRASVRGNIVKNIGGLKLVWGRGLLYVVTGLLQMAQMRTITYISGGLMALVGTVVVIAGASSAAQLMRLKKSLTDDAHLLYLFAKYDSDKDGYQVIKDFARFIVSVGLDLDDAYTVGAFRAIDKDHDGKISFIDFHKWWSQCTVRGNHVFRMKEQEINNFPADQGNW